MIWAVLKLLLKILSLAMAIPEAMRINWLNDCEDAFDKLKQAKTPDEKQAVAADLARLIRRM